jgi:type IV secretion system protein VirB2
MTMACTWKFRTLALGTLACFAVTALAAPDVAQAGVAEALEKIIEYINSKVARSLAILAVMLLGMGWWFGQIDWKRAGGIIAGVGIVFGAAEIVDMLRG